MIVVINRATWDNFIRSEAKLKPSFPQYPFLTKKEYYGNESLGLSNPAHFYANIVRFKVCPITLENIKYNIYKTQKKAVLKNFLLGFQDE